MCKIYVAKSRNEYKIGVSVNPERRMKQLRTGNPDIQLIYESINVANPYKIEHALHKIYSPYNVGGEWFSNEISNEIENIKKYVEEHSIYVVEKDDKQKDKPTKSNILCLFCSIANECDKKVCAKDKMKEIEEETNYLHEENETIQGFLNAFNGLDVENRLSNCIYRVLFDKTIYELRDKYRPKHYESFKNCLQEEELQKVLCLEKIVAQLIIDYVPIEEIEERIEKIASTF